MNWRMTGVLREVLGTTDPGWDALSRMVLEDLWGSEQIAWQTLVDLFQKLWPYDTRARIFRGISALQAQSFIIGANMIKNAPAMHLAILVGIPTMHESTDPKDKIYAMLGLIKDYPSYGLIPDYNISTNSLFQTTSRAILEDHTGCRLEFLNLPYEKDPSKRKTGLPSWSPDFSSKDGISLSGPLRASHFKAAGLENSCTIPHLTGMKRGAYLYSLYGIG